jgi:hypothetical protein
VSQVNPVGAASEADPSAPAPLDLRILTPGLTEQEIAAVTSVVSALVAQQLEEAASEAHDPTQDWRRSFTRTRPPHRPTPAA